MEAVLMPGEVLYIPPHWGHRVESLGWSVSVSAHLESEAVAARERIQGLKLPFEPRSEERYRISALRLFIAGLFSESQDKVTLSDGEGSILF